MAPDEISTLEAVAIYGISKVELFTADDGEEYHRPVFCKMVVVSPVAEQNRSSSRYNRVLRLYKTSSADPEFAEAQQPIELGQRVAINPDNEKVLKLRIDDYEFHIHAKETSLTVSRKTFASKDPIQLEKEVNQYLSACWKNV